MSKVTNMSQVGGKMMKKSILLAAAFGLVVSGTAQAQNSTTGSFNAAAGAGIVSSKHDLSIATGIGIAQILPVCRAFKDKGNKVIGIIGAKTKRALMLA